MSWTFPGAWNGAPPHPGETFMTGWGTNASNGTASAVLFTVSAEAYATENTTVWGPGSNVHCSSEYDVELESPTTYGATSTWISTPSNLTDAGEANNVSVYAELSSVSSQVFFSNGFSQSNAQSISTCGGSVLTLPVRSNFLTIRIPFVIGGQSTLLAYSLPFEEEYNYTFPGSGGTWQIDNLSAPGGPGGGWAFNYTGPCS